MSRAIKKGVTRWAHLPSSTMGELSANPPEKGELKVELENLAKKSYDYNKPLDLR